MPDSDSNTKVDRLNRRRVLGLLGGGAGVALAGCADDDSDDDGETTDEGTTDDDVPDGPSDPSELNLINSTFDELDPIMSTDTASSTVITQLYENLTAFPNGVPEVENQLLEEFEVSEDGTTWTFTIRDDVTFHDGSDLTADDVKYSWRRSVESPNTERRGFTLNQPVGLGVDVEEDEEDAPVPDTLAVEVLDDQTVEIQLVGPNPDTLDVIAYSSFSVIPEGYVGDIEGYDGEVTHQEFATEVANGTGPFELDEFNVDEDVRVVRNDDYYGEVADVESVHWEIIEDDQAAWTYALEKNADIFGIPTFAYEPDAIDAETDDRNREVGTYGPAGELNEEVNYIGISELSTFYFGFNATNVDRAVRQAVAYVLDQEQVVEDVFAGRGTPAYSFLPPGIWPTGADGYNDFLDDYPYSLGESDLQGAQSVLEDAGFTSDDPAELTLTTYVSEVFETAGELVRDLLAGSGVEMDIENSEFSVLQNRGEDGDLEMYTLGWIWSWPAAPYGSFQLEPENTRTETMPSETNGFYLDWQSQLGVSDNADKAQEAWERAVANPLPEDEELRQEAYVEMEEAVRDDAVVIPLYHGLTERFWYDYVDVPATGALGAHWQQYNTTTIEE